ncbi:MAG: glycosyltransferase family 4 protein [Steroidobacteraceae bacterium]
MNGTPTKLEDAGLAQLTRRIALVHDWLTAYVGGERVLEQMLRLFPAAELFTTIDVLNAEERKFLQGKVPHTTFAQNWPLLRRHYRKLLPLMMFAVEQLDVSESELVLSSSASVGKGILTGPDQLHIAYVHSPMRYAWDMQHQYLRDAHLEHGLKSLLARWLLHRARLWDLRTANGVDHFVANSRFIARRIWKVYRREATVIYPPVDVDAFQLSERKDDFYLTVSRMVPYKKIPMIVEAFRHLPQRRLVVIGDGTEMARVRKMAGPNVELLGFQSSEVVRDYMQRARAFVFAAEEDFGIAPVEAQACGTPVIAFGRGGALETVRGLEHARPTGIFFAEQSPAAIAAAVTEFEHNESKFDPRSCRDNSQRFSPSVFRERYGHFVRNCWAAFKSGELAAGAAESLAANG